MVMAQLRKAAPRKVLSTRTEEWEAVGLGETQLLVPTPDGQPEPRNRRVQVINLGR